MIFESNVFMMSVRSLMLVYTLFSTLLFTCTADAQISATLRSDPEAYAGGCPADIRFRGTITSEKPGKVQYKFIRSDGVLQPVETLEFSVPGTKEVNDVWGVGGKKPQPYEGWEAIKVMYPEELESHKSVFKVVCDQSKPDLTVRIKHCPKSIRPGSELGSLVKVHAINLGAGYVKDVDVEIVLKRESSCPVPTPVSIYSPHFYNGVLLKGGHERVSLDAGQTREIKLNGPNTVPSDTPSGDYYLCAVIDAGDKIKESNETNNCSCCQVKVATAIGKPDLVIDEFSFKGGAKCEPNLPIFTFEVRVKNIGTVASPAMPDKPVVQVMDLHGNNWGNFAGLSSIPPGGTQTVVIPVYFFSQDPGHMTKVVPHPFRAVVDPQHLIDGSNESNNKSDIIYLDPSLICSKNNRS